MLRKTLFLLIIIAVATMATAQYVRLTPVTASSALYLDNQRLINYNRYEHLHFEAALHYAYPSDNSELGLVSRYQWQGKAFAGYGVENKQMTYGGSIALSDRGPHRWFHTIGYSHQLEQAGATRLADYNMFNLAENAIYRANRFSMVDCISLSTAADINYNVRLQMSFAHSMERYLFDTVGTLLYGSEITTPLHRYSTLRLHATYRQRLAIEGTAALRHDDAEHPFATIIAQYRHRAPMGDYLNYRLFLQGGYASHNVPYSRLFDISGTAVGAGTIGFFFHNTMLTVAPNEFHAHLYARGTLTIELADPLYNWAYSSPIPFAQIGLLGGWLTDEGRLTDHATVEGIEVQAPVQGIAEPVLGVNRLLRWRTLEGGVAIAYRLAPPNAAYHRSEPIENMSLMVSLQMSI